MLKGFAFTLVAALVVMPGTAVIATAEDSQSEVKQSCCDKNKNCCDKNKDCEKDCKCTTCKCTDCKNADCDPENCTCEGCEESACECTKTACADCEQSACRSSTGLIAGCTNGDCETGKCSSTLTCDALSVCAGNGCPSCGEQSALHLFTESVFSLAPYATSTGTACAQRPSVLQTALELPCDACTATHEVKQVQYSIQVIEDRHGCMTEYQELRDGAPIMFAESKTLLPAIRLLHKSDVVRQLAAPKIICTAGQTAQVEISNSASEESSELWLEVASNKAPNGLAVELGVCTKRNCAGRTSLLVETGKSIVLNLGDLKTSQGEPDQEERAVYVVLTPEIVK
jgi:hypothetical protein